MLPYFTRKAVVLAASCPWDTAPLMTLEGIGGLVCTSCHLRLHRVCLLRAFNNTDSTYEFGEYFLACILMVEFTYTSTLLIGNIQVPKHCNEILLRYMFRLSLVIFKRHSNIVKGNSLHGFTAFVSRRSWHIRFCCTCLVPSVSTLFIPSYSYGH